MKFRDIINEKKETITKKFSSSKENICAICKGVIKNPDSAEEYGYAMMDTETDPNYRIYVNGKVHKYCNNLASNKAGIKRLAQATKEDLAKIKISAGSQ